MFCITQVARPVALVGGLAFDPANSRFSSIVGFEFDWYDDRRMDR
jgi:hypothetical protein